MKYYIKLILQRLIVLAVLPLRILPIRKNRILFLSLEGGSHWEYSCNPRYFCEYLLAREDNPYELVWLFRKPEAHRDLTSRGIKTAKHFTLKGFYYCLTSKVVITNGGYLTWFPFRRQQIRINTWHGGGAYKRLENDRKGANAATRKRMEFCNRNTTAFVSSSDMFTRYAIRGAFRFTGEVLPIGMPRNDLFFHEESLHWYQQIRKQYGLPENSHILLYAPTFREHTRSWAPVSAADTLEQLNRSTGYEWFLFYRSHLKAGSTQLLTDLTDHCIDVHSYPDPQHLLCSADLLITDYSSIVWDFCLTGRPIILYTPDLESYLKVQGFYLDIRSWKFPICQNQAELTKLLHTIMTDPEMNGSLSHQELLGCLDQGMACEKLLGYIEDQIHA